MKFCLQNSTKRWPENDIFCDIKILFVNIITHLVLMFLLLGNGQHSSLLLRFALHHLTCTFMHVLYIPVRCLLGACIFTGNSLAYPPSFSVICSFVELYGVACVYLVLFFVSLALHQCDWCLVGSLWVWGICGWVVGSACHAAGLIL